MASAAQVALRREEIARADHDALDCLNAKFHADLHGVSESQICLDRQSPTYKTERDRLRGGAHNRIASKSWKFVEDVIDKARNMEEWEPPEEMKREEILAIEAGRQSVIERGARMVQWYLVNAKQFETIASTSESNPALDMLAKIYGAPSEVEALKARNAELEAKMEMIERRLSALNGQGAEIMKDMSEQEMKE